MLNFGIKIFKTLHLRSHKGDEAETLQKRLCYYPLHKLCFSLLLRMRFRCYGNVKFPLIYNRKSERRPLLLPDLRYFDKSFTVMFLK